jgi:dihydrofolate reductase
VRKLFSQLLVSVDGYFEGPNHELDWFVLDDEFFIYVKEMLDTIDGIVLGRVTYDHFAEYWPNSTQDEAPRMNQLPKFVVSTTLTEATWSHSTIISKDVVNAVARLKEEPGRDLAILGGSKLATSLAEHGLIDEFRCFVVPVILGEGRRPFEGLRRPLGLTLRSSRVSSAGMIRSIYDVPTNTAD